MSRAKKKVVQTQEQKSLHTWNKLKVMSMDSAGWLIVWATSCIMILTCGVIQFTKKQAIKIIEKANKDVQIKAASQFTRKKKTVNVKGRTVTVLPAGILLQQVLGHRTPPLTRP
jgi:hypothetical protein